MQQPNYKFLIVDDHFMMRQMVSITLNRSGYTDIDTAGDGATALEKIKSAAEQSKLYDIVFLDWSMPDLSGYELLLSLRADKKLEDMAIIMLTSESETSSVTKAMESGATAYVTKPFTPESIISKLNDIHKQRTSKQ